MNITKYGWTDLYGYGFMRTGLSSNIFEPRVIITTKSSISNKIIGKKIGLAGVELMPLSKLNDNDRRNAMLSTDYLNEPERCAGLGIFLAGKKDDHNLDGRQKLYVVQDGDSGEWREYFTGSVMKIAQLGIAGLMWTIKHKDYVIKDVEDASKGGYKELVIGPPTECDALVFSESVRAFSKDEIKEMVRQFYILQQDAIKWGQALENAVKEVREGCTRFDDYTKKATKNVESDIASGFGKYSGTGGSATNGAESKNPQSDVESGFGKYARNSQNNPTQNKEQQLKVTIPKEIQKMWIEQGKCAYCGGQLRTNAILRNTKTCLSCGRMYSDS